MWPFIARPVTKKAKLSTDWGYGTSSLPRLRKSRLKKHAKNRLHIKGKLNLTVNTKVVPDASVYMDVWHALKSGTYSELALSKQLKMSRDRVGKIKWTLAESIRRKNRRYFKTPGLVVTLNQDVRHSYLCIRYCACNSNLERRRGVLNYESLTHWNDMFSEKLKEATLRGIVLACTPYKGCRWSRRKKRPIWK